MSELTHPSGVERMVPVVLVDVASMAADRAEVASHLLRYVQDERLSVRAIGVDASRIRDVNSVIKDMARKIIGSVTPPERGCALALEALSTWFQGRREEVATVASAAAAPEPLEDDVDVRICSRVPSWR